MARKGAGTAVSRGQDAYEGSPHAVYEAYGDSSAALEAYPTVREHNSLPQMYNHLIVSFLASECSFTSFEIHEQLDKWEDIWKGSSDSLLPRQKKLQELIIAYNGSLLNFAAGRHLDAAKPLMDLLRPLVADKKTSFRDNFLDAASHSGFLILECLLAISEARRDGLRELDETLTSDSLVRWLDSLDFEAHPRLKFLLALYKSRLDFAARDESGKMVESRVRCARKELKLAMEILNQKLRPAVTSGETASVDSASEVYPMEDQSVHGSVQYIAGSNQEELLQGLNQSALNLKANLEQLKGNTKKSLVLCAEALSSDPAYESIHANNLAVVYAASGKRNLALYWSAQSLRASSHDTDQSRPFRNDGTVQPEPTWSRVHNAAILAFQARNYSSAYECLAQCCQHSSEYSERPRCWLRMAEGCIGMYSFGKTREEDKFKSRTRMVAVEKNGEPTGVLLNAKPEAAKDYFVPQHELVAVLGSLDDLDQVSKRPLGRALYCLERVLSFREMNRVDKDCHESARCSLAYLKLELCDYQGASDLALSMLSESDEEYWRKVGGLRERMHKKRLACARMYASEALCALGNPTSAMQVLAQQEANQLSVDLAGGILPSLDVNDARRLVKAQALVQTNASAISAAAGDLTVAKHLAISALRTSEEDRSQGASKSEYSLSEPARNALLFCTLKGDREGALELLVQQ